MAKRSAASKATRGVSKAKKKHVQSSSSNPKTHKFRSQYNSLAVIAKGGPSKKFQNKDALKKITKDAMDRKKILDGLASIDMIEHQDGGAAPSNQKSVTTKNKFNDDASQVSRGTQATAASFASVWSNCTNSSLSEFFHVWNPNLETHKDALAVIAGLSQVMSNTGTEQTDLEFAKTLFTILSSSETPVNVISGALLGLTFVLRKLPADTLNENFDSFYPVLKKHMETYHNCKKKTLVKCLLRCFACMTKVHPLGKTAIESEIRKKINIAIRTSKMQSKISL